MSWYAPRPNEVSGHTNVAEKVYFPALSIVDVVILHSLPSATMVRSSVDPQV
jgi:hypothetical protein